ncbi:1,4-dihydroxy-2-naphthoate octaprenyltransferase [Diaminobutyricimonas aerilata]|uniref:1,4-dihydroxy-2-naphthoate octaprenyltransferase n=1 Tax=Diaminobutyricimonas aerilata TaxID=1162967 RepID=A0A2M9CGF4_9MICO|nr:1,4-dihydroxy-2-naphthoate octaprenyltransferase [Diaminobutyricimonas aerilata]
MNRATRPQAKGGRKSGPPPVRKATAADWIAGARIRTLPLAIAPVALGSACAYLLSMPGVHWVRALLCLAVALLLQIAVNYANDYSDGVRGTDNHRVGPSRLTGSGAAKPRTVLTVALVFFGLAALAGLAVVVLGQQWWLVAVGAACLVAGWFYTGGKRPYGYYGLGEVFVFIFFGLVATLGTMYVQVGEVSLEAWLCAAAIGSISCAVLVVNNIRDREQDALAGKRTLTVLIGDRASRILFTVLLVLVPFGILVFFAIFYVNAYLVYFVLLAAIPAAVITLFAKTPPELIVALRLATVTALTFGLGLAAAIAF